MFTPIKTPWFVIGAFVLVIWVLLPWVPRGYNRFYTTTIIGMGRMSFTSKLYSRWSARQSRMTNGIDTWEKPRSYTAILKSIRDNGAVKGSWLSEPSFCFTNYPSCLMNSIEQYTIVESCIISDQTDQCRIWIEGEAGLVNSRGLAWLDYFNQKVFIWFPERNCGSCIVCLECLGILFFLRFLQ